MPCSVVHYLATTNEIALLDDIEELGYGEIYWVEHRSGTAEKSIQISERTRNFFLALRTIGKVQKVIIHDSEPTLIEYRGKTASGYRCLKKMKM